MFHDSFGSKYFNIRKIRGQNIANKYPPDF